MPFWGRRDSQEQDSSENSDQTPTEFDYTGAIDKANAEALEVNLPEGPALEGLLPGLRETTTLARELVEIVNKHEGTIPARKVAETANAALRNKGSLMVLAYPDSAPNAGALVEAIGVAMGSSEGSASPDGRAYTVNGEVVWRATSERFTDEVTVWELGRSIDFIQLLSGFTKSDSGLPYFGAEAQLKSVIEKIKDEGKESGTVTVKLGVPDVALVFRGFRDRDNRTGRDNHTVVYEASVISTADKSTREERLKRSRDNLEAFKQDMKEL